MYIWGPNKNKRTCPLFGFDIHNGRNCTQCLPLSTWMGQLPRVILWVTHIYRAWMSWDKCIMLIKVDTELADRVLSPSGGELPQEAGRLRRKQDPVPKPRPIIEERHYNYWVKTNKVSRYCLSRKLRQRLVNSMGWSQYTAHKCLPPPLDRREEHQAMNNRIAYVERYCEEVCISSFARRPCTRGITNSDSSHPAGGLKA